MTWRCGSVGDGAAGRAAAAVPATAVGVTAGRKGHTGKVILIPLHCVAHSHDSRSVLNVLLVRLSKIEKRNR